MENRKGFKNYKIYTALSVVLLITVLFFPREGVFKYKYERGRPWTYETLLSPIDFPVLKTESELLAEKEQKASLVVPYYNYDKSVSIEQQKRLKMLQGREGVDSKVLFAIIEQLGKFYETGIVPEMGQSDEVVVVQRDKRASEVLLSELYTPKRAMGYIHVKLNEEFPHIDADSLFAEYRLSDYIVPNLLYDEYKTDLFHKEAVDYISPTKGMVYAGHLIVSEGEIVTAEIEQLLDSFKAEYESTFGYSGSIGGIFAGHALLSLLILGLMVAVLYYTNREVFVQLNKLYFILTLYLLIFVVTVVVKGISPSFLHFVPYTVIAIYLTIFFRRGYVFPLYTVMLLPLLFINDSGEELFFINLVGGIIVTITFKYFNRGWSQFLNVFFVCAGMLLTYVGIVLSGDGTMSLQNLQDVSRIAVASVLMIACYPFVFLFERIFMLVSQSRLLELSDTNNKLLRELATKAPGTFQHSLQVSNLAGEAVREIGGDTMLAQVGAMYHDIGKMNNPQCFVENAPAGVNYHKDLSPEESASRIIRHVDDGVEIAKKHRLPDIVIDFIKTHHAKSLTLYFYAQYCNNGGDPANTEPFSYHGMLPVTKEQVVVLMADAVEAASRSLKDYSAESISNLVENIIGKRLNDSQLVEADISIKDIEIVKRIFKDHLHQIYHSRIAYPELRKK